MRDVLPPKAHGSAVGRLSNFGPTAKPWAFGGDEAPVSENSASVTSAPEPVPSPRLILASASPRRRELLHAAGYDFEVHPAEIDEDDFPASILPADLALRLAQLKANAIADRFPDDVVLAADTVVALGDRALGKPVDEAEATAMLELLSGTTHIVITGVAIVAKAASVARSDRVMSAVRMKMLTNAEIRRYVESGDWRGKAGGYGIQDEREDPFVKRMAGSHSNIVGLPMEKAAQLLTSVGIEPTPKQPDAPPGARTDAPRDAPPNTRPDAPPDAPRQQW